MDKMVLLELTRQLVAYDKIQKKKTKLTIELPFVIGDYVEMCLSLATAEKSMEELAFYHLTFYITRSYFDPYNKIKMVAGMKFKHKFYLEDLWANARDDLEIRKRMFSRLPLDMFRICEIIQVPGQVKEDRDVV